MWPASSQDPTIQFWKLHCGLAPSHSAQRQRNTGVTLAPAVLPSARGHGTATLWGLFFPDRSDQLSADHSSNLVMCPKAHLRLWNILWVRMSFLPGGRISTPRGLLCGTWTQGPQGPFCTWHLESQRRTPSFPKCVGKHQSCKMSLERGPQEPLNLDMACSVPLEVSAHPLGPKKSSEFSKLTLRQPLPPFGAMRFYVIS